MKDPQEILDKIVDVVLKYKPPKKKKRRKEGNDLNLPGNGIQAQRKPEPKQFIFLLPPLMQHIHQPLDALVTPVLCPVPKPFMAA